MARVAYGRKARTVGRALLALMLAGCGQALAETRFEMTQPARPSAIQMPMLVAGVPIAAAAADSPPLAGQLQPALSHHLAGPAGARASGRAGNSEAVDPIVTSAIVRSVFGSFAIPIRNFPVAGRWAKIFRTVEACAKAAECGDEAAAFDEIAGRLEGASLLEKVRAVNSRVNRAVRYGSDSGVYGRFDHWASPSEVLSRRIGDCEDFVILKMAALMKAGVPANSLSLVVLQIRGKDVFHAVLSVTTSSGALILDNVGDAVLPDTAIRDYTPLYSLSAGRAWLHGTAAGGTAVARSEVSFGAIAPGEGAFSAAGIAAETGRASRP